MFARVVRPILFVNVQFLYAHMFHGYLKNVARRSNLMIILIQFQRNKILLWVTQSFCGKSRFRSKFIYEFIFDLATFSHREVDSQLLQSLISLFFCFITAVLFLIPYWTFPMAIRPSHAMIYSQWRQCPASSVAQSRWACPSERRRRRRRLCLGRNRPAIGDRHLKLGLTITDNGPLCPALKWRYKNYQKIQWKNISHEERPAHRAESVETRPWRWRLRARCDSRSIPAIMQGYGNKRKKIAGKQCNQYVFLMEKQPCDYQHKPFHRVLNPILNGFFQNGSWESTAASYTG